MLFRSYVTQVVSAHQAQTNKKSVTMNKIYGIEPGMYVYNTFMEEIGSIYSVDTGENEITLQEMPLEYISNDDVLLFFNREMIKDNGVIKWGEEIFYAKKITIINSLSIYNNNVPITEKMYFYNSLQINIKNITNIITHDVSFIIMDKRIDNQDIERINDNFMNPYIKLNDIFENRDNYLKTEQIELFDIEIIQDKKSDIIIKKNGKEYFLYYDVSNLDSSNNEYFERITNDINVIDYLNVLELSSVTLNFDTVFKTLYKDNKNEKTPFKKESEITNYDQFSHIKRFDICNNDPDLLTNLLTDISYYYNNDKFIEINTNEILLAHDIDSSNIGITRLFDYKSIQIGRAHV